MSCDEYITKFGTVTLDNGYYRVTSTKEGNRGKKLHRLIFEDFYQITLPEHIVIHHDDGNTLNNNIWNLIPMTRGEHMVIHHKGKTISKSQKEALSKAKKGIPLSEETKMKMSKSQMGKLHSKEIKQKISKSHTSTGIYHVHIHNDNSLKQGFYYEYWFMENGKKKSLCSVDLGKLKQRVLSKGLEWIEFDEVNNEITD